MKDLNGMRLYAIDIKQRTAYQFTTLAIKSLFNEKATEISLSIYTYNSTSTVLSPHGHQLIKV
jgi:hypothetical protein